MIIIKNCNTLRTKIHALLVLCTLCLQVLTAQEKREVNFILTPELKKANFNQTVDSVLVDNLIKSTLNTLKSEGYFRAHVDSVLNKASKVDVFLSTGQRYKWLELSTRGIDPVLLRRLGYEEKSYTKRAFRYGQLQKLFTDLVSFAERNGYPFASVSIDSVKVDKEEVSAILTYNQGPLIRFDSLDLSGNANVKQGFLEAYLRILPGQPYSQRRVDQLEVKIQQLPYVNMEKTPILSFQNKSSRISLALDEKKVNTFDGIIGFLPNEENDGKLLITGQVNMELHNLFKAGQYAAFKWQRLKTESQLLDVTYNHPNLLRSPLGFEGSFYLLKEDSTFLNRKARLEFQYSVGVNNKFRFFSDFNTTSLLSTKQFRGSNDLPDVADFDLTAYGLGYERTNIAGQFLPRVSGYGFEIEAAVGNKRIRKNSAFNADVYDGISLKNIQYVLEASFERYTRLSEQWMLKTALSGGFKRNERLFFNDLFRLGGLKTIRGFSENSLFAQDYAFLSNEIRLHFDQSSYLMLFYDQSYTFYELENSSREDYPAGLGTGISFDTGAGIFTLVYALGRSEEQTFSFNLSKVHFGFISRF